MSEYSSNNRNGKEDEVLRTNNRAKRRYTGEVKGATCKASKSSSDNAQQSAKKIILLDVNSQLDIENIPLNVENPKPKKKKKTETEPLEPLEPLSSQEKPKRQKKVKEYIPKPRSGGWAILIALLLETRSKQPSCTWDSFNPTFVAKPNIIAVASNYCDSSFLPQVGRSRNYNAGWGRQQEGRFFYTAWDSIRTLKAHNLVVEKSTRPKQYALTESGFKLAETLMENSQIQLNQESSLMSGENFADIDRPSGMLGPIPEEDTYDDTWGASQADSQTQPLRAASNPIHDIFGPDVEFRDTPLFPLRVSPQDTNPRIIRQNSVLTVPHTRRRVVDVILIVDNREKAIQDTLLKQQAQFQARQLDLGDFLWIGLTECGEEVVLDCIAERKHMNDLNQSIKDGRYKEQKFRLKASGLANIFYIAEGNLTITCHAMSPEALNTALFSTQILDGLFVIKTANSSDTVDLLNIITKTLQNKYNNSYVITVGDDDVANLLRPRVRVDEPVDLSERPDGVHYTYRQFARLSQKQNTVHSVFVKQLMELKGCSSHVAAAITKKYPTPASLIRAYNSVGSSEAGRKMLADIVVKEGRKLGKAVSALAYDVYNTR